MPATAPQDCSDLLRAMISFDTVTPHVSGRLEAERPLGEWLAILAERWGLAASWLPVEGAAPNLLLTRLTDAALPWRLLDSHLDTVGIAGMTVDPLGGETRDGRIYGRGACDTKGTGAAMLWAAREAIAAGALACNLAILFSVGEEHYQIGARSFIENDLPKLGWRPEVVVVGEPTRMQVVAACNGFLRWRMRTHGAAAHSSTPHLGHNAVSDMALAIRALEQQYIAPLHANTDASHPMTGHASCSINGIRGGVQHNIVPDACEIDIDRRLIPGETADDVLAEVDGVLRELKDAMPDFRYDFHQIESAPPFASQQLREVGERIAAQLSATGIASSITGAAYTTNANHYAPAGLPCVVMGPGDIAQAHTQDEWIQLEQLELGVQGYQSLMQQQG